MLLESATIHNKSASGRSISPPLGYALTYRDAILSHQQLGSSPLRNEIYRASADKLEQNKDKVSYLGINLLNQPFVHRGRSIVPKDISCVGMSANVAKVGEPAARAHLSTNAKDQEGATKEMIAQEGSKRTGRAHTTLTKGAITDDGSLLLPATVSKGFRRCPKLTLNIPAATPGKSQPTEWSFGESGIESHTGERSKVANESDYNGQGAVMRDTDLGYDQAACNKVLGYSRACEADKVLDYTDELQAKLAEHFVNAANIKISGTITSETTFPKMSAGLLRLQLLAEVIYEKQKSHADPSCKVTTAREKFALSKGVKFDSRLIDDFIAEADKEFFNPNSSFAMATDLNKKNDILLEQMALLELKVFGKAKDDDMLVEGSNVDRGKEMQSEPVMGGSKKKKRKAKSKKNKSSAGAAVTVKGTSKEHDMPVEGSTLESKGKECALLAEGAATQNGKAKESDLPPAESIVEGMENNRQTPSSFKFDVELLDEAGTVVLGPESNKSATAMSFFINFNSNLPVSSALVHDPKMIEAQNLALKAFEKMYEVMELVIRPQTASLYQLDLFCRFVRYPDYFSTMSPVIEELRWNR